MIRFGPFEIDPRTWTLARDGRAIDLLPHLVEVLGHLATHPGTIVTKSELLDRFWPGASVNDTTLTRAMAAIRKAIGDSASAPIFVQTLARRGYRFVGDTPASPTAGVAPPTVEDPFEAWSQGRLVLESLDRSQLDRAIASEPGNWRHHLLLAYVTWGEDRLRVADRLIELMPACAHARLLKAMVFVARGALARAEQEVARGIETQQVDAATGPAMPAAGLRWLRGLLLSARGERDEALQCFADEIAAGTDGRVDGREFTANARVAAGFVLLDRSDWAAAAAHFTQALAGTPRHARATLGVQAVRVLSGGLRPSDDAFAPVRRARQDLLDSGRDIEASLVEAGEHCVMKRATQTVEVLDRMLTQAPAGPAGWMIPVDPMLAAVRYGPGRAGLLAKLAARAW